MSALGVAIRVEARKALADLTAATRAQIARRPAAHPEILAVSSLEGTGLDALREAAWRLVEPTGEG